MSTNFEIASLSHDLEDAGWLGLSAASFLSLFIVGDDKPGMLTSTLSGFVWSKSLESTTTEGEFEFGIGKLKVNNALFSSTVGVHYTEGFPSHVDILFSFLGTDGAPQVFLELGTKGVVTAEKLTKDAPQEDVIIGYKNEGEPLVIPLPVFSIEFSFRFEPGKGIQSSVQLYDGLHGLVNLAKGVLEISLDKVLVFPKLLNLGLYVKDLFIDLSATGATNFSAIFPEAYDPAWKGVGAKEITFIFPVDKDEQEFIVAGVESFLYGFDGLFSGKFKFLYTNSEENKLIKEADIHLEIRQDEIYKSTGSVTFNYKKVAEKTANNGVNQNVDSGSTADKELAEKTKTTFGENSGDLAFNGLLKAQVTVVFHTIDNEKILGLDIFLEGMDISGSDSGLTLTGDEAHALFWALGLLFGMYFTARGINDNDDQLKSIGIIILILLLADIGATAIFSDGLLPKLEKLSLTQIGFRLIRITDLTDDTSRNIYELFGGVRLKFPLSGRILDTLQKTSSFIFSLPVVLGGDVFGQTLDNFKVAGNVDIEFSNLYWRSEEPDDKIKHLFPEKDLSIKARELPSISMAESEGSNFPKPIGKTAFVSVPGDPDNKYGISIFITGLANSSFSLATPAAGIVFYFYPGSAFGIDFVPQLDLEPKFQFIIPGTMLAQGIFDLNKPIPSFGGEQNRITVDVGLFPQDATVNKANMKNLYDFKKYKYQFGGELAWGEATSNLGPEETFDFIFAEVHYEGKSPLFTLGPVGFYGFGGLFGKNIRAGNSGRESSAMGIIDWITASGGGALQNVKNWPDVPAADGSTWHPYLGWDEEEATYFTRWTAGLFVKAGSAGDGGKAVTADTVVLVSWPEFMLAIAGIAKIKSIGGKVTVAIVSDSNGFAVKFIIEYKVKKDEGKVFKARAPFEIGVAQGEAGEPGRLWLYYGHYDSKRGGPIQPIIFDVWKAKAYYITDSDDMPNFGLTPSDEIERPTIPGPAFGVGFMLELGPKKFGPSYLNVRLYAALGLNLAISYFPMLLYGEFFLAGYLRIKVIIFKFKIQLLASLRGLVTDDVSDLRGEITFKVNLPWPIKDRSYSLPIVLFGDDPLPLPAYVFEITATGLARLETRSMELLTDTQPELPLDGAIAIAFKTPVYDIVDSDEPDIDRTALLLNDENPANDKVSEQVETVYENKKYLISYVHVLSDISVEYEGTDGVRVPVNELTASWEVPALYAEDNPGDDEQHHKVLYLNALIPPELQFATEKLGEFNTWRSIRDVVPPCQHHGTTCISAITPIPEIESDGPRQVSFSTKNGTIDIREKFYAEPEPFRVVNGQRLSWTSPVSPTALLLPQQTLINLPSVSKLDLLMELDMAPDRPTHFPDVRTLIDHQIIDFSVKLRGILEDMRFSLVIKPAGGEFAACGLAVAVKEEHIDPNLISVEIVEVFCTKLNILGFKVEMHAKKMLNVMETALITGHTTFLKEDLFEDWESLAGNIGPQLIAFQQANRLRLQDLCIEKSAHHQDQWANTAIAGDTSGGTEPASEVAVDVFFDHQLLEPGRNYFINYTIHTYATIYHAGSEGDEKINERNFQISTQPAGSELKTITFRTESAPSQDIGKYLGFSFPAPEMQAPYPGALIPLITFKYQGLIKKIFRKHFGSQVLKPQLVDINGNTVEAELTQTVQINSGSIDEIVSELLQDCLPHAQELVRMEMLVWTSDLQTNMPYSLQIKNTSAAELEDIPFNVSFTTSRHRTMSDHIAAVENLFDPAGQQPVSDSSTVATQLKALIQAIIEGQSPAFDHAVEDIYRRLLSQDGGTITDGGQQDAAAFIVGIDETTAKQHIWGVLIELSEPLIRKEGVSLDNIKPAFSALAEKGLLITLNDLVIVHDASGSRMFIFHSDNAEDFTPFDTDIELVFRFSIENALEQVIRNYIHQNYLAKSEADKEDLVTDTLDEVKSIPEIMAILGEATATLTLNLPGAATL